MSSFETAPQTLLWDATAVSNVFLCEYMPSAPEGYVKVYLYALMFAHGGAAEGTGLLADLCRALEMEEKQVTAALAYWERCRLAERVRDNPPLYRFPSPVRVMMDNQSLPEDKAYENFARAVYQLFDGTSRKIHGGDTVLAYEWVEQLGIPSEIVLMLLRHMMDTHGISFKFKAAEKTALELKDKKIETVDQAEAFFAGQSAAYRNAKAVLARLGKRREPSEPELELYRKWTGSWGFEQKALLAACSETTAAANPTFAYLDKVLEGLREKGAGTEASARRAIDASRQETERTREVFHALGLSPEYIGEGERALYRAMSRNGHELVMIAAEEVRKLRSPSLDKLQELLNSWEKKGLTGAASVRTYLDGVNALNGRLLRVKEITGQAVGRTEANRRLMKKWTSDWGLSEALLDTAAEFAKSAKDPMTYMDKVLAGWHEKGITVPETARADHAEHTAAAPAGKPAAGKVNAQRYEQRTDDLNHLLNVNPEELEEAMRDDS